ncbi:hypothetical protein RND71_031952 [Anisodus tanguticus]|uniref:KNOX1 domain-containing protein n=1 Tax=Anisodus tanguticus TaxID=243964 RepID=A0AAE1RE91_9SOLA|nr:hypothetical protein RND71_031952 [Anisodus tanguticus]
MSVKMRTTCTWTERPYEASLFPGIGFGPFLYERDSTCKKMSIDSFFLTGLSCPFEEYITRTVIPRRQTARALAAAGADVSQQLYPPTGSSAAASQASDQWLSRSILQRNVSDIQASNDLKNDEGGNNNIDNSGGQLGESEVVNWQNAGYKAEILAHPLFEQLLSAHVACLRIATPVDQLPRIDAQLAQSQQVVATWESC